MALLRLMHTILTFNHPLTQVVLTSLALFTRLSSTSYAGRLRSSKSWQIL